MTESDPVVITGIGTVTPLGPTCDSLLTGLREGRSAGRRLDAVTSPDGYYPLELDHGTKIGAPVLETPPDDFLSSRKKNRLTRADRFAVLAAREALDDARISLEQTDDHHFRPDNLDPSATGVLVGSHFGGIQTFEESYEQYLSKGPRQVSPLTAPGMMPNRAAGEIAEVFGLRGPGFAPVAASASSTYSLGIGLDFLRQKRVDVLLVGGTEAVLTPFVLAAFSNLKATTRRNDSPETASRPFDANRDGFLPGEGAGVLVLERLNHARKRRVVPHAELAGAGMTNDAHHITAPDPECDLDYTPNEPVEADLRTALVNSFGFGGHNASICLRSLSNSG